MRRLSLQFAKSFFVTNSKSIDFCSSNNFLSLYLIPHLLSSMYAIASSLSTKWGFISYASGLETAIVRLSLTLAFCCLAPVLSIIAIDLALYLVRLFLWNSTETYVAIKRRLSNPDLLHITKAVIPEISAAILAQTKGKATFSMGGGSEEEEEEEASDSTPTDPEDPLFIDRAVEHDYDNLDEDDQLYFPLVPTGRRSRHGTIISGNSCISNTNSSSGSSGPSNNNRTQTAMISKKSPSSTHLSLRRSRASSESLSRAILATSLTTRDGRDSSFSNLDLFSGLSGISSSGSGSSSRVNMNSGGSRVRVSTGGSDSGNGDTSGMFSDPGRSSSLKLVT